MIYDSADLLRRFRGLAARPAADEGLSPERIYDYLTEGQLYWTEQVAVHVPEAIWCAPTLLLSADGGETYAIPTEPLGPILLLEQRRGAPLSPGPEWAEGTGYVLQGSVIRWPGGRTRTFNDGPWARWVPTPDVVDATHEPTLPMRLRKLALYRALYLWAGEPTSGANPNTYLALEQDAWTGRADDPADVGLLGALKQQYTSGYGAAGGGAWWHHSDLG